MTIFFIYLLKVIVCSALFAGCYWLFLRNERFYHWNRFYIAASVVLSIFIPLLNIPISTSQIVMPTVTDYIATIAVEPIDVAVVAVQPETTPFPWTWLGLMCCMFVIFFLLAKEVVSFIRILRLKSRSERIHIPEAVLYFTDDATAPFTFFQTIFWKKDISVDSGEGRYMLRHELAHVRLGHSWDKALMQLVCCVFWMNPFFMLFRRELELVHEFAADSGGNAEELSSLILCTLYPKYYRDFTNRFFQSPIKRRIFMNTKNKKSKMSMLRKLSIVPVVLIAMYLFGCKSEKILVSDREVLTQAEQMPTLNGKSAIEGCRVYFNENSRYSPTRKDWRENGSKRSVYRSQQVSFVVNSEGKVENIQFDLDEEQKQKVKNAGITDKDLKAVQSEIKRVLSSTTWTPGRQDEKDVSVLMKIRVGYLLLEHEISGKPTDAYYNEVFDLVDDMPTFDGKPAETGFRDYVVKNVMYPAAAQENGIQGMVVISFIINQDGSLVDAKIERSVDPLLDAEALKVVNSSPKWTPGKKDGRLVRVGYTFPGRFRINK